jgi:hypothetical protein
MHFNGQQSKMAFQLGNNNNIFLSYYHIPSFHTSQTNHKNTSQFITFILTVSALFIYLFMAQFVLKTQLEKLFCFFPCNFH